MPFNRCPDVNLDGTIDILDVVSVLDEYTEPEQPDCVSSCRGDLDGNGRVNASDIDLQFSVWNSFHHQR